MEDLFGWLIGVVLGFIIGASVVMGVNSVEISKAQTACADNGGLSKITGALLSSTSWKCNNGAVFSPKAEE